MGDENSECCDFLRLQHWPRKRVPIFSRESTWFILMALVQDLFK